MRCPPASSLAAIVFWTSLRPAGALRPHKLLQDTDGASGVSGQQPEIPAGTSEHPRQQPEVPANASERLRPELWGYAHHRCRLSPNQSCSFRRLRRNFVTMVYPGGRTRCMFSDGPEYGFAVIPRDPDKLLFYFEGGGACWDQLSQTIQACTIPYSVAPTPGGIMNGSALTNPLKNHTVVYLTDCSGDLHSGDVQRGYKDKHGVPIEQRGFRNTWSAINWVKRNLVAQRPLSSLIATGESAGSIAAQVWAHTLLVQIPHRRASVIADSYLGAFPRGFQGPIFHSLNVCASGLLKFSAGLLGKCASGSITIPDVYEATIAAHPKVSFGSITSKYDSEQRRFYKLASMSMLDLRTIEPVQFRKEGEAILARYLKYPNHGHFIMSSQWHVYTHVLYNNYGPVTSSCFIGDVGDDRARRHLETWFNHYAVHDGVTGRYCEVLGADRFKLIGVEGAEPPDTCPALNGQELIFSGGSQALPAAGDHSARAGARHPHAAPGARDGAGRQRRISSKQPLVDSLGNRSARASSLPSRAALGASGCDRCIFLVALLAALSTQRAGR